MNSWFYTLKSKLICHIRYKQCHIIPFCNGETSITRLHMIGLGTANQRPTLTSECTVLYISVFLCTK